MKIPVLIKKNPKQKSHTDPTLISTSPGPGNSILGNVKSVWPEPEGQKKTKRKKP